MTFEEAVRPLMQYLAENHNPHTSALVSSGYAEIVEGVKTFNTQDYIKD